MTDAPRTRAGLVAVLGAPNAGKSTLVNRLVGQKVTIVSPKVQTTRSRIRGIANLGKSQIILVDTPGIFVPKRRLDRAMVKAAWGGGRDADAVVLVVDGRKAERAGGIDDETRAVVSGLTELGRLVVLAVNKIDTLSPPDLLAVVKACNDAFAFERTFLVSAETGDGVADLGRHLAGLMPDGPWLFPADQSSDQTSSFAAAEITREKLFLRLRQELPYDATVEPELWTENADGSVRIDQTIYVRREGQKAIVIGKGGAQLGAIGTAARHELERLFGRKVHLFLHVRVRENWDEDRAHFRLNNLDFDA